ncbi:hypothetical protein [Bombilactobacillus thymidiniphilus]|uniref:DUF443 family protein n=1 Tax=Bombilactobacillus thymidiniphilus TaxID=2923363 RepID=A0ABY4PBS2_9LACO|nr:hypothetical protein [Bombilactobacillus thymidiniphilus]UQS83065.1 hypothetical protein MOO47_04575 [Bombilactobacillus thymidiniphilus]
MSETDHRIHIVGRVNLQYYLIRYYEHYYLLDYSDPLQIENYGPLFSLGINKQFNIYDINADKEQFLRRAKHKYLNFKQAIIGWIIFLLSFIVLTLLLYNNDSSYLYSLFFLLPIALIVLLILSIMLLLKRNSKEKIDVSLYQSMTLELIDKKELSIFKKVSVVSGFCFLLWLSLDIGFNSANIFLLIIFGFLYPCFVVLNRFIVCSLDRVGGKKSYQIK